MYGYVGKVSMASSPKHTTLLHWSLEVVGTQAEDAAHAARALRCGMLNSPLTLGTPQTQHIPRMFILVGAQAQELLMPIDRCNVLAASSMLMSYLQNMAVRYCTKHVG